VTQLGRVAPGGVRVFFFAAAGDAVGHRRLTVAPQPLGTLLDALRGEYGPALGAVLDAARVWVNGEDPLDGDATVLQAGDEVAVVPPVSGGALP
jgi:molybdopterin converting factor small subunit